MTLIELKKWVDFTLEAHDREDPGEFPVLITTSDRSVGGRAHAEVVYAGVGIDWEARQFRLEPNPGLVKQGHTFEDPMPISVRRVDGRIVRTCERCGCHVRKDDRFCSSCGQKLGGEK